MKVIICFKESVCGQFLKEYRQQNSTFLWNFLQKTKTAERIYDMLKAALDDAMPLSNLNPWQALSRTGFRSATHQRCYGSCFSSSYIVPEHDGSSLRRFETQMMLGSWLQPPYVYVISLTKRAQFCRPFSSIDSHHRLYQGKVIDGESSAEDSFSSGKTLVEITNYSQQDASFLEFIHFCRRSTRFRRFLLPSSGAHNCTYSFRYCQPILLLAATEDKILPMVAASSSTGWQYLKLYVQLCSPDDGRRNGLKNIECLQK